MKVEKLLNARKAILDCADQKVSATLAYKMMKFLTATENEERCYNEARLKLIEKYAETDADGKYIEASPGRIKIKKDQGEACSKEFAELEDTETEAPNIKFSQRDLSELRLSVREITSLNEFIEEE